MNATYNELVKTRNADAGKYNALAKAIGAGEKDPTDEAVKSELAGLQSAIEMTDARIEAVEKAEALTGEKVFSEKAEAEGKSLDEVCGTAEVEASAFHALLKAQSSDGGKVTEEQARILNVNPVTLAPLFNPLSKRRDESGRIVSIDGGDPGRGGHSIPTTVEARVVERMMSYGPIRRLATVSGSATGRQVNMVTEDDTANVGEILGPNSATANPDTAQPEAANTQVRVTPQGREFNVVELKFDTYSSKRIGVRNEWVQDTATPAVIARMSSVMGTRLGRAQQYAFHNGTTGLAGCSNPGYLTAPTVGAYPIPDGADATGTGGKTSPVTFPEWANIMANAIDEAYWDGGNFALVVTAQTLSEIWALRDTQNSPVFLPNLQDTVFKGGPRGMLLGVPVYLDNRLGNTGRTGSPAASRVIGLFGDVGLCEIRDAMGMAMRTVDNDTLAVSTNSTYHYAFMRTAFNWVTAGDGLKRIVTDA